MNIYYADSSLCVSSDLPNQPVLLNESLNPPGLLNESPSQPVLLNESPSQPVLLNESPSQLLNEPMNLLQADVNFEAGNLFALQIL